MAWRFHSFLALKADLQPYGASGQKKARGVSWDLRDALVAA